MGKPEYFVTRRIAKGQETIVAKFDDKSSALKLLGYAKKHGYKAKYRIRVAPKGSWDKMRKAGL